MKTILTILTLCVLSSCKQKSQEGKTIMIDPNSVQMGEIVHDSLSEDQIQKIEKIHSTFSDVYVISLEETITNFKRDVNVDSEINVWLKMVSAYENYLKSRKDSLELKIRKEVFALILSRSMMPSEEAIKNAKLKFLTKEEADKVLSYYNSEPETIKAIQK